MLGAFGFLARVFGAFKKHKLGVNVLASSEVSVSLTSSLDQKQNPVEIKGLLGILADCADISRKDGMRSQL
jgi:aspartokinase